MTVHERKSFYKEQGRFYMDDMTLNDLSKHVDTLIEEYGPRAKIEYTSEQYDDGYYYAITALVPETDKEMQIRLRRESYLANQILEDEKRQLTMLLAKHGVPDAK
jgi:hypothetical protein